MKNLISILLLSLLASTAVEATTTKSFAGYQTFRSVEFDDISINGSADFKTVKIVGGSITGDLEFEDLIVTKTLDITGSIFGITSNIHKLHVIGPVRLTNAHIELLDVTGPTSLKNSAVSNIHSIGFLKAINSTIGNINAMASSIVLEDSKVGLIRVRKSNAVAPKITLNNSSAKNVIFESGNGKIVVIGNGEVTGKITGGIIVQE